MTHKYDPSCPDCRPAMLDAKTGQLMSDSHPFMKRVMEEWNKASYETREAYIEVTVNNSRDEKDLALCDAFLAHILRKDV